jgi:hypothetical protein
MSRIFPRRVEGKPLDKSATAQKWLSADFQDLRDAGSSVARAELAVESHIDSCRLLTAALT